MLEDTVRVGYDILYRPGTFSYILLSVFIKSNLEHTRPIAKKSCRHDFYHADMIFIMPTWFLSCRHYFLSTNANQIERLCDESVGWSGEDGDGWAVVHKNNTTEATIWLSITLCGLRNLLPCHRHIWDSWGRCRVADSLVFSFFNFAERKSGWADGRPTQLPPSPKAVTRGQEAQYNN
jgi:hypothetical protein